MGSKPNNLFIGSELMNIHGTGIKHAGTMKEYATTGSKEIGEEPKEFIGIDIETDIKTGNIKLLGQYNGLDYTYNYDTDFPKVIYRIVRDCFFANKNMVYWRKLDIFTMFKSLLYKVSEEEQIKSLERYGKIGGKYDKRKMKFHAKNPPVISVMIGKTEFGILSVIRSSVQFYFITNKGMMGKVWAYDIACLYERGIEKECLGDLDKTTNTYPNARLPYYKKGDEELHKINWDRFDNEEDFNSRVLESNMLDCRAVYDLAKIVESNFSRAFYGYYPSSLISAGAIARSGISAVVTNQYKDIEDEVERKRLISDDIKSIGISNYVDEWQTKYGKDNFKNMMCLFSEAYSGAYIETLGYGKIESCYMADIASDYPHKISQLWDLRGAEITFGKGEPPNIENSYCFIRGDVHSPRELNFNPITTKHPIHKALNIHSNGYYKSSYLKQERDYLIKRGGTFENEEWVNIKTTGKKSVLANVVMTFLDLRAYLTSIFDSASDLAKKCANSCYGVEFEAVEIHELINGKVVCVGFRAGKLYNPITASIITGLARIQICEACEKIEENGGKVISIMTDSAFYDGTKEQFPIDMWRKPKTLGFFDEPERLKNFVCLGAGRYEYQKFNKKTHQWDELKTKTRGFSMNDIIASDGVTVESFNWQKGMEQAIETQKTKIHMSVRVLVSVGLVLHNSKYPIDMLGMIVDEDREVDIIAGKEKRFINMKELINKMQFGMVYTTPYYWGKNAIGEYDMTLPYLRKHLMELEILSPEERMKTRKTRKNKVRWETIKDDYMKRYHCCKEHGLGAKESNKMAKKGWTYINQKFNIGGFENEKVKDDK